MNTISRYLLLSLLAVSHAFGQDDPTYVNFIRQVQLPDGLQQDATVTPTGEQYSSLGIKPEGADFELWTIKSPAPITDYLLQSTHVGTYVPIASLVIDTEDPWGKKPADGEFTYVTYANPTFATSKIVPTNLPAAIRRTRADRPFKVYVTTDELRPAGDDAPDVSKKLDFLRHLQSYGTGNGDGINRNNAILSTPALPQFVYPHGVMNPLTISLSSIAGADRRKLRGEERFTVMTLLDNQDPLAVIQPRKLCSEYLQIWPMTDGVLSGIAMNQVVKFAMPTVTFQYTDTYPGSETFAQIYKGEVRDNAAGLIVPGSHCNNTAEVPKNYLETTGSEFDRMFDSDGRWTIEVLTVS
ncbi:MAG: hypothetical protein EOP85_15885, partial [Verrucomicrobiaceae bacterium]